MINCGGNWFRSVVEKGLPLDQRLSDECRRRYGRPEDGHLTSAEFRRLLGDLFADSQGRPHSLTPEQEDQLFASFDLDRDGLVGFSEFDRLWKDWLTTVLRPTCALLVVDVQNDFISGSLALKDCPAGQDGAEVVPVINELLAQAPRLFRRVAYTQDWHPDDHISFAGNVSLRPLLDPTSKGLGVYDTVTFACGTSQKLWPAHCVQGSWGAEFHPRLTLLGNCLIVRKGTDPEVDSYSAFWDNAKKSETGLAEDLRRHGISDVFVAGLALDVCVAFTARHALDLGLRTTVLDDACRGVSEEDVKATREELRAVGALVVSAAEVAALATGRDRRPAPALRHAMNLLSRKS